MTGGEGSALDLHLRAVEIDAGDEAGRVAVTGSGTVRRGPVEVAVSVDDAAERVAWHVANRGDTDVPIRSVALVFGLPDARPPVRMFRNGYQSWSPTGVATLGVDADPSTRADFPFLQAVHHADQRTVRRPGELRSEAVTVLVDERHGPVLAGFEGGDTHDGTFRLADEGADGVVLRAEAFLGGAVLPAGASRTLHPVVVDAVAADAPDGAASLLLARWAAGVGVAGNARVAAPYVTGWCSWYHYFTDITEATFLDNVARASDWPFDVLQLDDGFQAAIGDWLEPDPSFPRGLPAIAEGVAAAGRRAGLWLAPFLVAPNARLAADHPDWVARTTDGRHPLRAWWNPDWHGGDDGFLHALDTTDPAVADHLERLARDVVAMGFDYLKLDFTFAPSVDGRWHDPTRTPAERVRAGFDALRRGAGDDTTIVGCGVPLGAVVGVIDACRIGPDVAPRWALDPTDEIVAGYLGIQPATRHAYVNTLTRSFMHRQLWQNDPDCVMLRTTDTDLSPEAATGWARAVGLSGGLALVSDDLALLDGAARAAFDATTALGRASDEEARAGRPAAVPDLLDAAAPRRLRAAGHDLVIDPDTGRSSLTPVTTDDDRRA